MIDELITPWELSNRGDQGRSDGFRRHGDLRKSSRAVCKSIHQREAVGRGKSTGCVQRTDLFPEQRGKPDLRPDTQHLLMLFTSSDRRVGVLAGWPREDDELHHTCVGGETLERTPFGLRAYRVSFLFNSTSNRALSSSMQKRAGPGWRASARLWESALIGIARQNVPSKHEFRFPLSSIDSRPPFPSAENLRGRVNNYSFIRKVRRRIC